MAAPRIEFVLFDLGGVLVDPGGVGPMRALAGIETDEELWSRWLGCRWVRAFEAGRCSPEEFAAGVVGDWDLALEPAAFLEAFGGWHGGPYPGAVELVRDGARRRRRSAASPTPTRSSGTPTSKEPPSWRPSSSASSPSSSGWSSRTARSSRRSRRGCPSLRQQVLFLDDNAANVAGAEAIGFAARHVRGVDEARLTLAAAGVLAT